MKIKNKIRRKHINEGHPLRLRNMRLNNTIKAWLITIGLLLIIPVIFFLGNPPSFMDNKLGYIQDEECNRNLYHNTAICYYYKCLSDLHNTNGNFTGKENKTIQHYNTYEKCMAQRNWHEATLQ